jgi:hypothetical protein
MPGARVPWIADIPAIAGDNSIDKPPDFVQEKYGRSVRQLGVPGFPNGTPRSIDGSRKPSPATTDESAALPLVPFEFWFGLSLQKELP